MTFFIAFFSFGLGFSLALRLVAMEGEELERKAEGIGDGTSTCRHCGKPYLECKDAYK